MSALGTGAQSVPRPTTLVHTLHHTYARLESIEYVEHFFVPQIPVVPVACPLTHACTTGVRGFVAKLSALAEVIRSSVGIRADSTRFAFAHTH